MILQHAALLALFNLGKSMNPGAIDEEICLNLDGLTKLKLSDSIELYELQEC